MQKIKGKQIESISMNQALMPDELKITTSVGEAKIEEGRTYKTISKTKADGSEKSVWELFTEIFSKDNNPEIPVPYISLNSKTPNNTTVEVGTVISPYIKINFNKGQYQFGTIYNGISNTTDKDPIITPTLDFDLLINDVDKGLTPNIDTALLTGRFSEIQIKDGQTIKIKATAEWTTSSNTPLTQLGNVAEDCKIIPGSSTITETLCTAYRKIFYGTTTVANESAITDEIIRALPYSTNNKYSSTITLTEFGVVNGGKSFIVAIPKSYITATRSGVSKVLNDLGYDITNTVKRLDTTIEVGSTKDNLNKVTYVIWFHCPAEMSSTNKYKVTLK